MCIKRILIHCNLYISTGLFEVYNHFCGVPIIFSFFQNCCCDCIFHMVCEQHLGDETSSSVKWQKTMESCNFCAGRTPYPKNIRSKVVMVMVMKHHWRPIFPITAGITPIPSTPAFTAAVSCFCIVLVVVWFYLLLFVVLCLFVWITVSYFSVVLCCMSCH